MLNSSDFKNKAKETMGLYYSKILAMFIITALISAALACTYIGYFIIAGPLVVGINSVMFQLILKRDVPFEKMFNGFNNFLTNMCAYLLQVIYAFLWSLLFIIPGIIKAFSYSATAYLLAKNPNLSASQAIEMSKTVMNGNKWRLFCLYLSFIGWFILSALTAGILYIFYVGPYLQTTLVHFYDEVLKTNEITSTVNSTPNMNNNI